MGEDNNGFLEEDDENNTFNSVKDGKTENVVVLMPYGKRDEYPGGIIESRYIYNCIIVPAVKKFAENMKKNITLNLEFQKRNTGSVTTSILENIAKAEICIVDISGHNPNVFFELGVRYSLRNKITILLRQEKQEGKSERIPFDIQGFRYLSYNSLRPKQSIDELYSALVASQKDYLKTDSLVFETFKHLEVRIPDMKISSFGEAYNSGNLSWEDWWERIQKRADELDDIHKKHSINVIIGISNGGLVVADLIGRLKFKDVPILSLWADRRSIGTINNEIDRTCYFFDNKYNQAVMDSIKEMFKDNNHKIGILLVDDLIYTSNTCLQAKAYINREFEEFNGEYEIIFAPLFCRRSSDIPLDQLKDIIISKYIKDCNSDEYLESLESQKKKFPYYKDLY